LSTPLASSTVLIRTAPRAKFAGSSFVAAKVFGQETEMVVVPLPPTTVVVPPPALFVPVFGPVQLIAFWPKPAAGFTTGISW